MKSKNALDADGDCCYAIRECFEIALGVAKKFSISRQPHSNPEKIRDARSNPPYNPEKLYNARSNPEEDLLREIKVRRGKKPAPEGVRLRSTSTQCRRRMLFL